MSKKVLLGLSGGVDSAIAAYRLKEQGYDVTGAFMRNWDAMANGDYLGNPTVNDSQCPQEKDYDDAKAVAAKLGIPLLRIDYIKEYDCDTVVIGLPLSLDGSDSIQTEKVREFRRRLENKLRSSAMAHVKVDWMDERFTTVIAESVLSQAGMTRQERKKIVDRQAAIVILQSYMDRQHNLQS